MLCINKCLCICKRLFTQKKHVCKKNKITFFVQDTDSSESTVPSTDDTEVPDKAEDNKPYQDTVFRKFQSHWLAFIKWLKFDNDKKKRFVSHALMRGLATL